MPRIEEVIDSDGENAENSSHTGGNSQAAAAAAPAATAARTRPHLEDWQEEEIANFMGIVDTTAEQAHRWLQSANWNTNQAVNLFYGDEGAAHVPNITETPRPPEPAQPDNGYIALRAAQLVQQLKQLGMEGSLVESGLQQFARDHPHGDDARVAEKARQLLLAGQASGGFGGFGQQTPAGGFGGHSGFSGHSPTGGFGQPASGFGGHSPTGGLGQPAGGFSPTGGFGQPASGFGGNSPTGGFGHPFGGFGHNPTGGFHASGFSGYNPNSGFGGHNPNGGSTGSRFDQVSGLEISDLGAVEVKWGDLPIVVRDLGKGISVSGSRASAGDVVISLGDVPLWGKSKEEIISLEESSIGMGVAPAVIMQAGNVIAPKLKKDGLPIHPQAQCNNCRTMPLIGKRFHCRKCPNSVDFCGTCYAGRAHAHPSDHSFEMFEWFNSQGQPAISAPQLQQRASVVVCGSGTVWDGMRGVLQGLGWDGRWQVEFSGSQVAAMPAANLFLRPAPQPVRQAPPQPAPQSQAGSPTPGPVDCSDEGYEKNCGVPMGLLGRLIIKWCQIPVIVQNIRDADSAMGAIEHIGGVHVWGKSRKEVEELNKRAPQVSSFNIPGLMKAWQASGAVVPTLRKKLRDDFTPIHPEATCCGCGTFPLVGWRYSCTQCPSFDLCGTCHAARAHSHPAGHSFVKVEYSGGSQISAEPGMVPGPGARAVVCGTGDGKWDGREVEVLSCLGESRWHVSARAGGTDRSQMHSAAAANLFLLSPGRLMSVPQPPPVRTEPSLRREPPAAGIPRRSSPTPNPHGATCSEEGYDTSSGVPVSLMGKLLIKWCQMPVIITDITKPQGTTDHKAISAIGGVPVWGKSRAEVEMLNDQNPQVSSLNVPAILTKWWEGGAIRNHTRLEMRRQSVALHPEATCSGCSTFPLVGWRYSCTQCHPSFDLCGTCYPARVHSHPASHPFLKLEFPLGPGDQEVPAEPGWVMGPKAKAVVCGTGDAMWDGREVEVLSSMGGALWRVSACKSPLGVHSVTSANLFLLSPGQQGITSQGVPGPPPTDTFKSFLGSIQPGKRFRCPKSGLEISSLRHYQVRWCQLPVILDDPEEKDTGKVVAAVKARTGKDNRPLWGVSREQAEELEGEFKKTEKCLLRSELPKTLQEYEVKMEMLKKIQVRVHPEVKCEACEQKPLVGQRYSCSSIGCESTFCGACYRGRAHAHPPNHRFTMRDFHDSEEVRPEEPLHVGQGALAVVCGTGDHNLDGKEVVVQQPDPVAGWQVTLGSATFSVHPRNLFLLSRGTPIQEVQVAEEDPSDNPDLAVAMLESLTKWPEDQVRRLLERADWDFKKAKELAKEQDAAAGVIQPDQVELLRDRNKNFLGQGSFGKVWRAKLRGEEVAAKVVDLQPVALDETEKENLREKAKDEAAKMKDLRHPNILGFKGILLAEDEVIIFSDYCEQGSLRNVLLKMEFDDQLAHSTVLQVAKAMQYLHGGGRPLAHRDLKSLNILMMRDFSVKVGDFGLTTFTSYLHTLSAKSATKTPAGSAPWMAPEIFKAGRRFTGDWLKCDIYSFACVIFEILTRQVPWQACNTVEIIVSMTKGQRPDADEDVKVRDCDLKKLMTRCWVEDPLARPAFDEIVRELEGSAR